MKKGIHMVSNSELKSFIVKALNRSMKVRGEQEFLVKNNSHANLLRSSKFVYEFANSFWESVFQGRSKTEKENMLHVQGVDDSGKKSKGEWLFDVCITDTQLVSEEVHGKQASSYINTKLLWAIESESATSLFEFCEDFGKLLCSGSKSCIYLHGLNQQSDKGRKAFIERRLSTINNMIKDHVGKESKFYIGFWPSPKKVNGISIWDNDELGDLSSWIEVYDIT